MVLSEKQGRVWSLSLSLSLSWGKRVTFCRYLDKWESKQLDLLQAEVDDEAHLFDGEVLTAEEKHQHQLSKKILAMARDRPLAAPWRGTTYRLGFFLSKDIDIIRDPSSSVLTPLLRLENPNTIGNSKNRCALRAADGRLPYPGRLRGPETRVARTAGAAAPCFWGKGNAETTPARHARGSPFRLFFSCEVSDTEY